MTSYETALLDCRRSLIQVNASISAARQRARRGGGAIVRWKREVGKKCKARDRETSHFAVGRPDFFG